MELYEGVVVNNDDPKKIGRVQIRIPVLHGNGIAGKSIGNSGLPWFEPCMAWYGGYQSGSFIVPPIGSVLWCLISENQSGNAYRVYIGGSYGVGAIGDKQLGGKDVPPGAIETPSEALNGYPGTSVIFKSLNGSSIYVDNTGAIVLNAGGATMVMTGGQFNLNARSIRLKGNVVIEGSLDTNARTSSGTYKSRHGLDADTDLSGRSLEVTESVKYKTAEGSSINAETIATGSLTVNGQPVP